MYGQTDLNGKLRSLLERSNAARMAAYRNVPRDIMEHYGIEQTMLAGGYGYRQILELVQNGADAILEASEQGVHDSASRIQVLLHGEFLYVANTGAPLSEDGVEALLSSHSSPKRGNQIGRFGLGFKSLLRLGGRIDIFTRASGGLRFDPERCRREIRTIFEMEDVPSLRMAWFLEIDESDGDPILSEMSWAETIVRAALPEPYALKSLREEIRSFPAEFLLFFPVSTKLTLCDDKGQIRELSVESEREVQVLRDGEVATRWRVSRREVKVDDPGARADATHIHARDTVPLAWAFPLDAKREESGRFWSFFPTQTPSYVPGIVNAPWKLNSDRNAIIGGRWNEVLMREAARLIAEILPELSSQDDPGRPLDAFPRKPNQKDEIATPLIEGLWTAIVEVEVIPDGTGTLRHARDLWRYPRESRSIADFWLALADENWLASMVHPSCLERHRERRLRFLEERMKPRIGELTELPRLRQCDPIALFSAVASADPAKAMKVFKLAEAFEEDCKNREWESIRTKLAIVPSDDGLLLTAEHAVFAPEGTPLPASRHPVARSLCEHDESRRILSDVLGVKCLDDSVWVSMLDTVRPRIHRSWESPPDEQWISFWKTLRLAPQAVSHKYLSNNTYRILVRRRDDAWVSMDKVVKPGALIDVDDPSPNQELLVDTCFHANDGVFLKILGVSECPDGTVKYTKLEDGIDGWLRYWRQHYLRKENKRAKSEYLGPFSVLLPKGWNILPQLSGIPLAKLTSRILRRTRREFSELVSFGHYTVQSYSKIDVSHPLPWILLRDGAIQIGSKVVRLAAIVDRLQDPAVTQIPDWDDLHPLLEKLASAVPKVTSKEPDIEELWLSLIELGAFSSSATDESLRQLWASASKDGVVPRSLTTESGEVPLGQILVSTSLNLANIARKAGRFVVTLDETTLKLWIERGARSLSELMNPEWTEQAGPVDSVISIIPELAAVLHDEVARSGRCQIVQGLKLVIEGHAQGIPCLMWQDTLLIDLPQLERMSRMDRFEYLLTELATAGWLKESHREAANILCNAKVDELREKVAQGATLAERLILAVGKREQPLKGALSELADAHFVRKCSLLQLAELTLAQLGPATLSSIRGALEAEGLKPPKRWNSPEARAFVASIGFPEIFSASLETRRDAEVFISGPIELPPLHDFQEDVFEGIEALLASGTARRRGVVSLPTGGGKTRVTVEAAVRLVLAPCGDRRSVLWIAQMDELCEQAVQSFRQVWINIGAQRTDLRIVRLWGGNPNPSVQEPDKPVVVIASIQTLNSRMERDDLAWLQSPGLVVVDECHHAITPSYSNLLRWLDAEAPRSGSDEKDEPPIIGLSATPFRTDDAESRRLAKRFDNRWFPPNQEELNRRLRLQGVLARPKYEALQSGASLLKEEMDRLEKMPEPWEGFDFENLLESINQRLAGDTARSQRLVDYIQKSDAGSILFFANSVLHSEEISARLNVAGIPAAAVSGKTPKVARRYFLDRFQKGEIRVLCNHSVLSTGFDAPRTDMVFIARQVFSPVRYMQMVGRGLRGEKNGGTEHCQIVTVTDNLGRFQERHPYHYCRRYFTNWGA